MPCRSDYMEPNVAERQRNKAARLLVYICDATGRKLSTVSYRRQAKDPYGNNNIVNADRAMIELCRVMKSLNVDEFYKHVYDGRIPLARELAEWWEEHTAEDRKREAAEAERERVCHLATQALKKLSDEEYQAVQEYFERY